MDRAEFLELFDPKAGKALERKHLLRKLYKVFKDGYRPARGNEYYNVKLDNGVKAYEQVNCLGHVFNLRNQQFNDYKIKPYKMFGYFSGLRASRFKEDATEQMFDFIKETGLKIEECDPKKTITDFKSWKVALYFHDTPWHKDFHFLLEDAPRNWSSKLGFEPYVEHNYELVPPKIYRNLVDNNPDPYEFYGTYKITNPNADENNRYVKDRTL